MHTELAERFRGNELAQDAAAIAVRCMQCGQCTANYPTLHWDSPRTRLPDQANARRSDARLGPADPPRPLPYLPFLQSHVPGACPFRPHARHHARTDRADQSPSAARTPAAAGCCGALSHDLAEPGEARAFMRRNIDAGWPQIEAGAEAIVMAASGSHVRDYGELLRDDPPYRDKARHFSELSKDTSEIIDIELKEGRPPQLPPRRNARPSSTPSCRRDRTPTSAACRIWQRPRPASETMDGIARRDAGGSRRQRQVPPQAPR